MMNRRQIPFPRYLSRSAVTTASLGDISSALPFSMLALNMSPEVTV